MNRLALAITSVLVLVPNLNYQTPTLDTPRSDSVVVSFFNKPKVEFPDRSVQAKSAKEADIEKARLAEIERVRALEVQKQVSIAEQAKVVPNTPQIAPQSPDSFITALGQCESGNTANRNSGNGYYGAFQFSIATWNSMGTGYARADLAPYEVQVAAVKKLLSRSSVRSQFPGCSAKLGL